MTKKIWILLFFSIFALSANLALADCLDLGSANSWYIEGAHTVVFYRGQRPMARVEVPYCTIYPDSQLRLTKSYMCDSDRIIVDGTPCTIMTISSASGGSF